MLLAQAFLSARGIRLVTLIVITVIPLLGHPTMPVLIISDCLLHCPAARFFNGRADALQGP